MLSECYLRVNKDDFAFGNQKVRIHPSFHEYSLSGDVYHDAGFDALMTGVVWYKMMTYLGRDRSFPGVDRILNNNLFNSLDKNKIPMSSLRNSMNLSQEAGGLSTDGKSFVFVMQNVPLFLTNEEIQQILTDKFKFDIKVYRAYNKTFAFFTVFNKQQEENVN